jgi:ribonucleoside-diphosphate reductase subunit M1
MYYLRTKPAASAIQFTVDKSKLKKSTESEDSSRSNGTPDRKEEQRRNLEAMVCSLQNKDDCLMCGS